MLWSSFLQKQALTGSLQNSCLKKLFGRVLGRPESVLEKDSILDILLESMQKHSDQLTFHNTMGGCFQKFKYPFSRISMNAFKWMNWKSYRNKYLQESVANAITKYRKSITVTPEMAIRATSENELNIQHILLYSIG